MSNESKIGLLAIITIALFIIGFKFIKGQNVLSSSQLIYVKYNSVDQLAVSSPIFINGFQVGVVSDIYLDPDNMSTVIAILDVDNDIKLHPESVAEIMSLSMMSGKGIRIVDNKPCNGNCVQSGEFIKGRTLGMLEAMVPAGDLERYLSIVKDNMGPAMDSLNAKLMDPDDENLIGKTFQDLQQSMNNLKTVTDRLNTMLASSSGKLNATLANTEAITGNLKANNEKITTVLDNFASISGQLKEVDLKKTVDKTNATLSSSDEAIIKLKTTLENADKALAEFTTLAKNVNEGNGAVSMLMKDEAFAQKLNKTVNDLDVLLKDVKEHPYNYMPLKSRRKVTKWRAKDEKAGN